MFRVYISHWIGVFRKISLVALSKEWRSQRCVLQLETVTELGNGWLLKIGRVVAEFRELG